MPDIADRFRDRLAEASIRLTDRQLEQFDLYYRKLVEWNEKVNLTAITDKEQVYVKHFYDSLSLSCYLSMENVGSLADIGAGAGFPGIPLKIVFPHLQLTLIDSLKKRIAFLESLVFDLSLAGVTLLHGRAEDVARMPIHRDAYDVVAARAVARLSVLAEYCMPFVRRGGFFVSMKGTDPGEELSEAAYAIDELGGEVAAVHRLLLPPEQLERHIIKISKRKPTPGKYPRKAGIPLKSPLSAET